MRVLHDDLLRRRHCKFQPGFISLSVLNACVDEVGVEFEEHVVNDLAIICGDLDDELLVQSVIVHAGGEEQGTWGFARYGRFSSDAPILDRVVPSQHFTIVADGQY